MHAPAERSSPTIRYARLFHLTHRDTSSDVWESSRLLEELTPRRFLSSLTPLRERMIHLPLCSPLPSASPPLLAPLFPPAAVFSSQLRAATISLRLTVCPDNSGQIARQIKRSSKKTRISARSSGSYRICTSSPTYAANIGSMYVEPSKAFPRGSHPTFSGYLHQQQI